MPNIVFPNDTSSIIDQIREAIGREVIFYTETRVPCSGCSLDPITDTSINSFCPICHGIGYQVSGEDTPVLAHITWGNSDNLAWQVGGKIWTGDVRFQISYTVINKNLVDTCKYITVDNRKVGVKDIILRGVPSLNRILVDCILEENQK
jgi:hypothetical protein